ncbi:hypothetical protein P879_07449 [Paragonimus westermani]|uniref:Uncharacterized protein n=1 Tax=Paragonimus westermani TaxID=34504 RepID=A0A8T0DKV8_9TREM|nr:hypothetical protein P879_07449 [Paragonimus westermani]
MRNERRAWIVLIWCYVSLFTNLASAEIPTDQNNELGLSLWSKCKTNYLDKCSFKKIDDMRKEFLLGFEEVGAENGVDVKGASLKICYIFYLRCSTKENEIWNFKNEQKRMLPYPYPWLPRYPVAN